MFLILILVTVFVALVVANFCYIHELEKRIERLEIKFYTTKCLRVVNGSVIAEYKDDN